MSSLKKQAKSFDPKDNPFLKANNPYRIAEKFYTQSSSQEKFSSRKSSHKSLKNSCNHCTKNTSLIQQMKQKSSFFNNEKQNIQKMSSLKYRAPRLTQNPFQRKRLIIRDSNVNKNQQAQSYSRNDQQKLISLLQNNPLKKYQSQRQSFNQNDNQIDIEFHQIKMFQTPDRIDNETNKKDSSSKQQIKNHLLNYGAMRFSVDSLNNKKYTKDSVQNSPVRMNKISPSFANLQTHRRSSTSSSQENQFITFNNQYQGLIKQISRSRKELFDLNSKKQLKQIEQNNLTLQDKIEESAIKPISEENQNKIPDFIVIKGQKFFLNIVKLKY